MMQHFVPDEEHRGAVGEGRVKEAHLPPGVLFRVEFSVWGSTFFILRYMLQKQSLQKCITAFFSGALYCLSKEWLSSECLEGNKLTLTTGTLKAKR